MTQQLDEALIHEARALITGANVHRVNNLIFCYQEAIRRSNEVSSCGKIRRYDGRCEQRLRDFVRQEARLSAHSNGGPNPQF